MLYIGTTSPMNLAPLWRVIPLTSVLPRPPLVMLQAMDKTSAPSSSSLAKPPPPSMRYMWKWTGYGRPRGYGGGGGRGLTRRGLWHTLKICILLDQPFTFLFFQSSSCPRTARHRVPKCGVTSSRRGGCQP